MQEVSDAREQDQQHTEGLQAIGKRKNHGSNLVKVSIFMKQTEGDRNFTWLMVP